MNPKIAARAKQLGITRSRLSSINGGYAVGALLAGLVADAVGVSAAISMVAVVTAVSGLVVALRMAETLKQHSNPISAGS